MLRYGGVENAREQQKAVMEGLIEREAELRERLCEEAAGTFLKMVRSAKKESEHRRYVLKTFLGWQGNRLRRRGSGAF